MRIGATRVFTVGFVLGTSLAACSDGAIEPTSGTSSTTVQESPASETTTVQVADSDLGSILVDSDGMTLYLFEADTDGSSTCYGGCATTWPALVDDAPVAERVSKTLSSARRNATTVSCR